MKGKSKSITSGALKGGGAKGGSGHMFGKQSVGTKTPGISGKSDTNSGGKWAKGGSGHMAGKQKSKNASPNKRT